jgi:hypothetical protein
LSFWSKPAISVSSTSDVTVPPLKFTTTWRWRDFTRLNWNCSGIESVDAGVMCLNCWNAYPILILAVIDPFVLDFVRNPGIRASLS